MHLCSRSVIIETETFAFKHLFGSILDGPNIYKIEDTEAIICKVSKLVAVSTQTASPYINYDIETSLTIQCGDLDFRSFDKLVQEAKQDTSVLEKSKLIAEMQAQLTRSSSFKMKDDEAICLPPFPVRKISPLLTRDGDLFVTSKRIYFRYQHD